MKRSLLKISASILLAIMMLSISMAPVLAYDDPSTIVPNDPSGAAGKIQTIGGQLLAVAQVIGVAVAVIMLIVLAIKYMSSAPNDRAEIKKHAVVYIVGAVVLFGASAILGIIRGFAESIG